MGSFQQPAIKVEKEGEFRQLRAAIERAFLPEAAERFLKLLDRANIRIRDFDADFGGAGAGRSSQAG